MLQAIVDRAQRSVDTLVSKYVTRAAVAVPFVIAIGFGTAAATVKLTEEFGSLTAYAILAAAFGAVGLAAAAAIAMSGPNPVASTEPVGEAKAAVDDAGKKASIDPEMILAAIGAVGPAALPAIARLLVKNLPLVFGLVVIAYLLLSKSETNVSVPSSTSD